MTVIAGTAGRTAIACVSRLAEAYESDEAYLTADRIAEDRSLTVPFVRKVLASLVRGRLVRSTMGPGGGYALDRSPREITVRDVLALFERMDPDPPCPFGNGVCGAGEPCPLHEEWTPVRQAMDDFLANTTFEVFRRRAS